MPCPRPAFILLLLAFLSQSWVEAQRNGSKSKGEDATPAPDPEELARIAELRALPNVIFIIADDLAWDDLSPFGHESIMTPNLQRLADGGMRFDRAFLTTSSCSPTRASLITGRFPHQTDAEQLHWPVPKNQVTFVEKLREKGYWTGAAGKWHLGEALRERFDKVIEADESGFQLPSGEAAKSGEFSEKIEGEAQSGCTDWVPLLKERAPDRPFFLWLAALDPHRPYHDGILKDGARPEEVRLPPYHPDTPAVRADYQNYYDEITRLDRYIGLVLDELEAAKLSESTAIFFLSDNGRPFPRDKTTLYDSGIRTPLIIKWPEKIAPGTVCERLVSTVDLAKTVLSLAKIEKPGITFEGIDLSPLFTAPEKPLREYVFAEKNWHDYEDRARAVRNERYKYIRNDYPDLPLTPPADVVRSATYVELLRLLEKNELSEAQQVHFLVPRPAEELYDLRLDPHELNNLAADPRFEPVIVAMRAALADWETKTEDVMPTERTPDEFDRLTGLPTPARIRPRPSKAEMAEARAAKNSEAGKDPKEATNPSASPQP
ncbi:MAG: sulfatase [Verrucomicrobiae bacterium]|nr:sulfatase [Verrucomicrobiae bacterium]